MFPRGCGARSRVDDEFLIGERIAHARMMNFELFVVGSLGRGGISEAA